MKKIILAVLTFVLVVSLGNACFAASENQSVGSAEYNQPQATLEENINDEGVPKASALPKTGGIPSEVFYVVGGLLVVSALVISRVTAKSPAKH